MIAMIATIVAIAVIQVIAEKNSSEIVAIDGFPVIATIADKVNEDRGDRVAIVSDNIVCTIRQIQHGCCELSIPA